MRSLCSRNKALVVVFKNDTKIDIKVFCPCRILFDIFTLFHMFCVLCFIYFIRNCRFPLYFKRKNFKSL